MKKLASLFAFLLISISAQCDTIDFWHVYLNDSLIAKFNENSKDLRVTINKAELRSGDTLTVRYGTCVVWVNCHSVLTVFVEIKQSLPEAETHEYFGKLSIPFSELLQIEKRYGIAEFPFHYDEKAKKGIDSIGQVIFVLTLK